MTDRRKGRKALKMALGMLGTLAVCPGLAEATTFGELAGATFGMGGPGAAVLQILLICIVVWLAMYMASAVGNGQAAAMMRVTGTFACMGILASLAWGLLKAICAFAGIQI